MVLKAGDLKSQSATVPCDVPACGSQASGEDSPSSPSSISSRELARNLLDSVKHRILHLSEQLRVEKASRDRNTAGYLKLVSTANQHQAAHIREAFERVNQRLSASIAHIERRLRQYHQQLRDLEESCWRKGVVLKGQSSRHSSEQLSATVPSGGTPRSGRQDGMGASQPEVTRLSTPGKSPEMKPAVHQGDRLMQEMKEKLMAIKKLHCNLQVSCENLKENYQADLQLSLEALREKKCRRQSVEQQLNDHLQGYLDEIYHLRQHLACTEEKMAYLSYERAKEIWEVMETFKSRIAKLETLQQADQLEMVKKARRRPQQLLIQFVSLLLTVATIFLVLISTLCACPCPLVKTRLRTCTFLVLIGLVVLAWHKRHVIPTTEWQAWITSKWRLYTKDPEPLSEGT